MFPFNILRNAPTPSQITIGLPLVVEDVALSNVKLLGSNFGLGAGEGFERFDVQEMADLSSIKLLAYMEQSSKVSYSEYRPLPMNVYPVPQTRRVQSRGVEV